MIMKTTSNKLIGISRLFLFSFVAASLFLYSCRRDKEEEAEVTTEATQDHSQAESIFDDVLEDVRKYTYEDKYTGGRLAEDSIVDNGCPEVTINLTDKRVILDFGDQGCLHRGRIRKGKVFIDYTGRYYESGTVITTSFENHYIDNVKVEGRKVVENKGNNVFFC